MDVTGGAAGGHAGVAGAHRRGGAVLRMLVLLTLGAAAIAATYWWFELGPGADRMVVRAVHADVSSVPLAVYAVTGDGELELTWRAEGPDRDGLLRSAAHELAWSRWGELVPEPWVAHVSTLVVATDGPGGRLAAVAPDPRDEHRWMLEVDPADLQDEAALNAFDETLVHELGHVVTLGPEQVRRFRAPVESLAAAEADCWPSVGLMDGCARPGSHMAAWVREFWGAAYLELVQEDRDGRTVDLYGREPHRFPNRYAASSPEEDLAEAWRIYVMERHDEVPSLHVADKVAWFDSRDELAELAGELRVRLARP